MNEKRFTFDYEVEFEIFDRVTKKHYDGRIGCQEKICDLLNEQQATIQFLQDEIDELKKDIDIYEYEEKKHSETVRKLYEENEKLRKELGDCEKFRYTVFQRMRDVLDE